MSNAVQTLIFNASGRDPVEIRPQWDHISWRLNAVGEGKFFLSYSDPNCTPGILKFGSRILVQFESGLQEFGGVIDDPVRQQSTGVTVTAYTGERKLRWRRTAKTEAFTSTAPGTIFQTVIENANMIWNTGISIGSIYTGGTVRNETYHYSELLQLIVKLQRLTLHDFEIVPSYRNGLLSFVAHWYERLGSDLSNDVPLIEGKNVAVPVVDWQGPIANQVLLPGGGAGGTTWDDRLVGTAQDTTSRDEYDYREFSQVQTGTFDQVTLDASAESILTDLKAPSKRGTVNVVDKSPAKFGAYRVGDRVRLQAFVDRGPWAFDGAVRIMSREWTPDNTCRLEVIEWAAS